MNVTFHLKGGGQVVLDLVTTKDATAAEGGDGWLWDRHGAGVDLSEVVGISPGNTASGDPIYPDKLIDGDGDEWTHVGRGNYRCGVSPGTWSYTHIRKHWGIQAEGSE